MNKNIVWIFLIAAVSLISIWGFSLWTGGCSSTLQESIAGTTTTSNGTGTTISFPSYTSEFVYLSSTSGLSSYNLNPSTGKLTAVDTINSSVESEFGRIGLVGVDPSNTFLFTGGWIWTSPGNYNSEIHAFKINPSTGILAAPKVTALGNQPNNASFDPSGKFVCIGGETNQISIYGLNSSTGGLTFVVSKEAPSTSGGALFTTVDPTGKFVYAGGQYGNQGFQGHILAYQINSQTGALDLIEAINTSSLAGILTDPRIILIDRQGKFMYVEEYNFMDILVYGIDQATGKLSLVQTEGPGGAIGDIAIDPLGRFLYVVTGNPPKNVTDVIVKVYRIDPTTGKLSSSATKDIPVSSHYIAADPSGKFICLAPDNFVAIYGVEPSTGDLTLIDSLETGTVNYKPTIVGIK